MQFDTKNCDHKDLLFISKRQASIASALFMILCLVIFLFGYFWGKYTAVHEQSEQELEEILLKEDSPLLAQPSQEEVEQGQPDGSLHTNAPLEQPVQAPAPDTTHVVTPEDTAQAATEQVVAHPCKALLAGFGTQATAQAFARRLANKGIEIVIQEKTGKTARGKKRTWYQALTKDFTSQEELQKTVQAIIKLEHIKEKDITILAL